jgi:hypothetical protein
MTSKTKQEIQRFKKIDIIYDIIDRIWEYLYKIN